MDFVLTKFVARIPILLDIKGCLVFMFALVYISKSFHAVLSFALANGYDNVQVFSAKFGLRSNLPYRPCFLFFQASYRTGNVVGLKIAEWKTAVIQRASNAHCNQLEAFAGFSAATLLALTNMALSEQALAEITQLANAFLYVRLLYNAAYILAFNRPLSAVRSGVFTIGIVIIFKIFALAGANFTSIISKAFA